MLNRYTKNRIMKLLFLAVLFAPVFANSRLNYFYRHHRKTNNRAVNIRRSTSSATFADKAAKTPSTPVFEGMCESSVLNIPIFPVNILIFFYHI